VKVLELDWLYAEEMLEVTLARAISQCRSQPKICRLQSLRCTLSTCINAAVISTCERQGAECIIRHRVRDVISMANGVIPPTPALQFPTHNAPRVWLLTSGDSPIGVCLARKILDHGDYVVSGIIPADFERDGARSEEFQDFLAEVRKKTGVGWKERLRIVALDVRCVSPALRIYLGRWGYTHIFAIG
jgi:hypothetical protein